MYRLLGCIVIVHALLLLGMFDVYFQSPIVPNLPPVPSSVAVPSRRLVLFVGDGLRSDHFFDSCNAPFLRNKIEAGDAVAGISHTHVPTESRPGTIAIAAGVYEDPSAVFKGWQDNPVPVDSFFNRCRYTFAWGSPDIVHLFSRGSENVNSSSYSSEDQSFNPRVSLLLNQWVLNNFIEFLNKCKNEEQCFRMINEDKISYFFHFIGIDMAGHKSKPHSKSYNENIIMVDSIIKNITGIFEELYNDDKTTYVFTSDHGMTDWGSHGAGSPDETKTPLVAWGSGVKKLLPQRVKTPKGGSEIGVCQWALSPSDLYDVEQADIAALMSALLGVEFPTNNLGTVPVDYLGYDRLSILSSLHLNARQLHVLYSHLESLIKEQCSPMFFSPFKFSNPLHNTSVLEFPALPPQLTESQFKREAAAVRELIYEIKRGIEYYQTYFQNYLLLMLTLSFLGLIGTIFGYILDHASTTHSKRGKRLMKDLMKDIYVKPATVDIVWLFILTMVSVIHFVQWLPFMFYVYAVLPLLLWWKALNYLSLPAVRRGFALLPLRKTSSVVSAFLLGVYLLYYSFYHRWILSIAMVSLSLSPFVFRQCSSMNIFPVLLWSVSGLALSFFPLFPTVGGVKLPSIVLLSGLFWIGCFLTLILWGRASEFGKMFKTVATKVQIGLMVMALLIICYIDYIAAENTSKTLTITVSWTLLAVNFTIIFVTPSFSSREKIFKLFFSFGIAFTMMSVSYEAMFLPILSINMGGWIWMEVNRVTQSNPNRFLNPHLSQLNRPLLELPELINGGLFLFFIIFSYFGIGNIDSLNSFDINSVRCFIDVFSPFTMTFMLILKIILPIFVVSCSLRQIVSETKADPEHILLISVILCELMGLMFLFKIRNTGSWLDIGTSISHYVIMEVSAFALVILYVVSGFLLKPTPFSLSRIYRF